ncbi:Tetratricopeptide TPR_1 repeat-containing protein [Nostoc sp. PCC 7107]|nr:Tetratricopeptide TPR_1 repeat-containing protein [Nostoc sp. PCC 7107]
MYKFILITIISVTATASILIKYIEIVFPITQALAQIPNDPQAKASSLVNQGNQQLEQGKFEEAIHSFQEALNIYRKIKDQSYEAITLQNLADAYSIYGKNLIAIDYYQKSLSLARKVENISLEREALFRLTESYELIGNTNQAVNAYEKLLPFLADNSARYYGGTLGRLGNLLLNTGKVQESQLKLLNGIKVIENGLKNIFANSELSDISKVFVRDRYEAPFITLQRVFVAQKNPEAALETAEWSKARVLVELVASRLSQTNHQFEPPQPPKIKQIQQIAKEQNATLVEYSIIHHPLMVKIPGKREWQESELYIWVVKPTGKVTFHSVNLTKFQNESHLTLDQLVNKIPVSSTHEWSKYLKQLHKVLIQPIAAELPKNPNEHIVFIPDDALFFVPFAALKDENGKYLIERHTILTSPSIQVLSLTHQQNEKLKQTVLKDVLVVGNPRMPKVAISPDEIPRQLEPLPFAEVEANNIAKLFNTKAIIGKDATKINVLQRMKTAQIIHLATHGWAEDQGGLGSWIALAPYAGDNGLLTAEEILSLKLKAKLVVLSACETAKGSLTGDGVVGLSRSLIAAGTPSVIVSLWNIPDESTQLIMTEFYQHFQQDPDKAQALRQAMLVLIKQGYLPLNWAAFTLIGEP